MGEPYYAARIRRDPQCRPQAIATAVEHERARRENNPEAFRARRRSDVARCRERQMATGFTFHELWLRIGPRSGAGRDELALVLRQEVAAGRVDYFASSRRYRLTGGLPDDVREAPADLYL